MARNNYGGIYDDDNSNYEFSESENKVFNTSQNNNKRPCEHSQTINDQAKQIARMNEIIEKLNERITRLETQVNDPLKT